MSVAHDQDVATRLALAAARQALVDAQASIRKHQAAGLRMTHELDRLIDKLSNLRTAVAEHLERNPTGAGVFKLNGALQASL